MYFMLKVVIFSILLNFIHSIERYVDDVSNYHDTEKYQDGNIYVQAVVPNYEKHNYGLEQGHQNYIKPDPYSFGYDIKDQHGNKQFHREESDEHGTKRGSYGYTDAFGIYRHVEYVADALGFRATIKTNEPGTAKQHPSHVKFDVEPPPIYNTVAAKHIPVHAEYDTDSNPAYAPSEQHAQHETEPPSLYNAVNFPNQNEVQHHSGYKPVSYAAHRKY